MFVKDVVTHLPYYTVNRAVTQRFFAYMIDEERIIGLKVSIILSKEVMNWFMTLIFSRLILRKSLRFWSYTYLRCSDVTYHTHYHSRYKLMYIQLLFHSFVRIHQLPVFYLFHKLWCLGPLLRIIV